MPDLLPWGLASLVAWDTQAAAAARDWVQQWPRAGVWLLAMVSHLGDRWVLTLATLVVCTWVAWRGHLRPAALAAALVAGQGLLVWGLKDWWQRPRPPLGAVEPQWVVVNGSSLPSGHATAALVAFVLLAWLALRHGPRAWQAHRRAVLGLAVAAALAVGSSRVLLGVHHPGDVLAGWCIASAWLALSLALLRRLSRCSAGPAGPPGRRR